MLKHLCPIGLLAVSILLAAPLANAQSAQPAPLRAELLDPKSIEPISAEEFRRVLARHQGSVVVVNLWATWCVPCLKELPDLARLQQAYAARGVKIITVSMDDAADLAAAKTLLAERGPGLRGYLQTESEQDKFVSVIDPAWAEIMPTSFVLDREGKLSVKLTGGKSLKEFESAIAPLLDEKKR